jgi:hypothetical protein
MKSAADPREAAYEYVAELMKNAEPGSKQADGWFQDFKMEKAFLAGYAFRDQDVKELVGALKSANKTLRYAQEEYAHGHGVHLIYETIETNKRALAKFKAGEKSDE